MKKVRVTFEEFIERAKSKHGDKYRYDKTIFTGVNNKVNVICPTHGEFQQIAHSHLSGSGCSKCSFDKIHKGRVLNNEDFIVKSKRKHGDKYDYSLVNYIDNVTKVKIICPIHGEFEQKPQHHKRGSECQKCANIKTGESAINTSRGWSLSDWENKLKKSPDSIPILYVIKCFNDSENFIKIGITMRSVKKRFCNKTLMPYEFEMLFELTNLPKLIFNTEIKIKQELIKYKYIPTIKFSGWNECFNLTCEQELNELLIKHLK